LKDIETVKDLVERVGAASLKKLIDVMARWRGYRGRELAGAFKHNGL